MPDRLRKTSAARIPAQPDQLAGWINQWCIGRVLGLQSKSTFRSPQAFLHSACGSLTRDSIAPGV